MSRANDLTISVIKYLTVMGWMAWRQNNNPTPRRQGKKIIGFRKMSKGSRKGVPDVLAVQKGTGILWGFEIKADKDKQSLDQVDFQADLERVRGKYVIVHDMGDVLDALAPRAANGEAD